MNRSRIMIIGAGDFQLPIVQRAAQRYDVLLVAPEIGPQFEPYASSTLRCDVRDKERILAFAREKEIDGVTTDQTDIAVATVAYVAENLGLPGIGYATAKLFTNKRLMREKLRELGIPQLPNRTVSSCNEALAYYAQLKGKVVIKPLDTQGSRGVQLCSSAEEIERKYNEASRYSSNGEVLVERFAEGREFVVEGMALDYSFRNLICGDTYYFDLEDAFAAKERIFPTDADDRCRERVLELNETIIRGFGLKQGISHSEFIMEGEDVYLIETAARGGGVFISSDLISLSTGLCTEDFLIDVAMGNRKELPTVGENLCSCGYMAMFIPAGEIVEVRGKDEVLSLPYVHRNQLEKLFAGRRTTSENRDKTSRLAIIVSAPDRKTLKKRMDHIRFLLRARIITEQGETGLIWE